MNKVMLKNCNIQNEQLQEVIAIGVFGSYHEECFRKEVSDVDIMILSQRELSWEEEFEIEDYLQSILPQYFQHDEIHYTFIHEFTYPYSELLLMSQDKIIFREECYLDYALGYSAFKRDRENLECIREQNLKELEELRSEHYKYKKGKLQDKFSESKVFLVKIRVCIKRNPTGEDDIIDEAMISYFNSFCEFIIDMCETYLVTTDNYIPNKSGPELIGLAGKFGFIELQDSKKLQNIVKLRNRYTHDYYQRKLVRERILKVCKEELKTLDLFLEISEEKIMLVIRQG